MSPTFNHTAITNVKPKQSCRLVFEDSFCYLLPWALPLVQIVAVTTAHLTDGGLDTTFLVKCTVLIKGVQKKKTKLLVNYFQRSHQILLCLSNQTAFLVFFDKNLVCKRGLVIGQTFMLSSLQRTHVWSYMTISNAMRKQRCWRVFDDWFSHCLHRANNICFYNSKADRSWSEHNFRCKKKRSSVDYFYLSLQIHLYWGDQAAFLVVFGQH